MASRLSLLLIPLVGLAVACGGADRPAPYSGDGTEDPTVDPTAEPEADAAPPEPTNPAGDDECLDGEARECKVQLPTQGKTKNCFVGVQRCEGGKWGACGNP